MSFAPEPEQEAFVTAHPDLYVKEEGPARLRIQDGRVLISSLDCRGFAVKALLDFASMRPMPMALRGPVGRPMAAG